MAKKFKLRIPKRVAGVKIPKIVRKGPVAKFLNSSAGQLVLAEALVVVGGALAAEARGSGSGPAELGREPLSGVSKGGGERADTGSESSMLPSAFHDAVRAFRTSLEQQHQSKERDTTQEGATADTGEVQSESARPKKKAASSPTEMPSMPH
jgi:hypothetical protein